MFAQHVKLQASGRGSILWVHTPSKQEQNGDTKINEVTSSAATQEFTVRDKSKAAAAKTLSASWVEASMFTDLTKGEE
jgi:hypothetical protein